MGAAGVWDTGGRDAEAGVDCPLALELAEPVDAGVGRGRGLPLYARYVRGLAPESCAGGSPAVVSTAGLSAGGVVEEEAGDTLSACRASFLLSWALDACDLAKSWDGLGGWASGALACDPVVLVVDAEVLVWDSGDAVDSESVASALARALCTTSENFKVVS